MVTVTVEVDSVEAAAEALDKRWEDANQAAVASGGKSVAIMPAAETRLNNNLCEGTCCSRATVHVSPDGVAIARRMYFHIWF